MDHKKYFTTPDLRRRLNVLYSFYHCQWWCYRQQWNRFKFYHTLLNAFALLLVATGMIVGPVLQNSTLVACLTAVGTFVKGWTDFKQYRFKLVMAQFGYTTYAKTLTELRMYARGLPPEGLQHFLIKMQTLDDIIVDLTPPITTNSLNTYQDLLDGSVRCPFKEEEENSVEVPSIVESRV